MDIEALVDFLEAAFGEFEALGPDGEVFGVALLEFDEFLAAGIADGFVGFCGIAGMTIEAQQFGEGILRKGCGVEDVFPRPSDHAKLSTPIADVVVGDDLVAEEAGDAGEAIANDGGADVADVHRLGDVWRGEIEHDGAWSIGGGSAEASAVGAVQDVAGEVRRVDAEIDEARAGDFGAGWSVWWQRGDDLLREGARIGFSSFGKDHSGIRLVVAKA